MEIRTVEYFNDRFYKITEEDKPPIYLPSVTTKLNIIAKPFLAIWRGDIGNREADMRVFESSERGIRIHHAWYTLTTYGIIVYQPFQRPNYNEAELEKLSEENGGNMAVVRYQDEMLDVWKLQRWFRTVNPKIVASELNVYSLENRDAGTLDNLFYIQEGDYEINGAKPLHLPEGLYIADLKTGKAVDDNAYMQTAAYANCVKEMGLGEPIGTLILHTQSSTKKAIEGMATHYRNKEQMEQDYQDYRLAAALWERKNADAQPKLFEFPALLTLKENENVEKSE